MKTIFLCLLSYGILFFFVGIINHWLTPLSLSVFIGGVAIVYPSLETHYRKGVPIVLITGLFFDAASPFEFGTMTLAFLAVYFLLRGLRRRLRGQENQYHMVAAFMANLVLFLLISVLAADWRLGEIFYWKRVGVDLLLSQIILIPCAWWLFSFLRFLFLQFGVDRRFGTDRR